MSVYEPNDLLSEFRARREQFTGAEFFNRPGMTRLQEMWCAARFAAGVEHFIAPCRVSLEEVDDQSDTDFTLLMQHRTHDFQIVEIQKEGRRRGAEYKQLVPGSTWLEALAPPDVAIERIWTAIEKKAQKRYARQAQLQLLVYVNMGSYDLHIARHSSVTDISFPGSEGWIAPVA